MNLAELLTIPAANFPDAEILRIEAAHFTYDELQQTAASAAAALTRLGVAPGDRVAVLDTNSAGMVQLLYGCASIGAVFVPLNFRARLHELRHMFEATSPKVVIAGHSFRTLAAAALSETSSTAQIVDIESVITVPAGAVLEVQEIDDDALAMLIFTSGTTAAAKAVMLAHADLVNYVFTVAELASGEDAGSILVAAPLHHIAGLAALLTATWAGRRIVLMRQFEPGDWLALAETQRVTHAFLVPTMLKRVLEHPRFATTDLSHLQVLAYGAAPMPLGVIRRAITAFPPSVQFVNAFGQTETASTVTMLYPEDHRLTGVPAEDEVRIRRLASIGRPLPDVELRILSDDGLPLPVGQVGEIAIASNRLMRGYYGQAEATQATLRDGWLRTRDLGWIDEGGYVFLAGRKSDMIIRGGENIAPEEVEIVLESHRQVEEAAVFGRPDEEWGEVIVAAVVTDQPSDRLAAELIQFCRERLGSYKAPQEIHFVEALPRNDLGKLLRKDLRDRPL